MLTRETDYAIRVLLLLVQARRLNAAQTIACKAAAGEMGVPYRFLRKIVPRLVVAGLVVSTRGRGGGLRLARDSRRISLLDVVQATGVTGALLGRCVARPADCSRSRTCRVHWALRDVQKSVNHALRGHTLDTLA